MPSFCDGVSDWEGCFSCSKYETQHPCWSGKIHQMQEGTASIQLGRGAVPNRYRASSGRKSIGVGEVAPEPKGPSEESIAMDHAIPRDERGLPFLGKNLEPMTRKQISNMGSNFEKRRRALAETGQTTKHQST